MNRKIEKHLSTLTWVAGTPCTTIANLCRIGFEKRLLCQYSNTFTSKGFLSSSPRITPKAATTSSSRTSWFSSWLSSNRSTIKFFNKLALLAAEVDWIVDDAEVDGKVDAEVDGKVADVDDKAGTLIEADVIAAVCRGRTFYIKFKMLKQLF